MSATNSHRTEEPMKPDTQTPLTRDHLQRLKKDKLITSDNWVETPFAEWLELELYAAQNDRDRFEESNRQAWEANARLREQLAQARDEALEEVKKFCKDLSDSSYERFPAYAAGAARCAEGIGEMRHAAPAAQAAPSHMAAPYAWAIDLHGPADFYKREEAARGELARRNEKYPEKDRKLVPLYTAPPSAIEPLRAALEKAMRGYQNLADLVLQGQYAEECREHAAEIHAVLYGIPKIRRTDEGTNG